MKNQRTYLFLFVLLSVSLFAAACGSDNTEPDEQGDIEEKAEASEPVQQDESASVIEPTQTLAPTSTPLPTPTPAPTETPAVQIESLVVAKSGFGQTGRNVGFGFILENPNESHAFERFPYEVKIYDDSDVEVKTSLGFIDLISPGQSLGLGGDIFIDEGVTVSRIEVQLDSDPAKAVATDLIPDFSINSSTYFPSESASSPYVRAEISNPHEADLRTIGVSAITFDGNGEIIGGGLTFVNFIPAKNSTGVEIKVNTLPDVASVEIYPITPALRNLSAESSTPSGAEEIQLIKSGYSQDSVFNFGYGFLIENTNADYAVQQSSYRITMYSEDDQVLGSTEGRIEIISPGQTLGIGGTTVSDGVVSRADIQILSGEYIEPLGLPSFTAENVAFTPDEYNPSINGEIVSSHQKEVTNLKVNAIAYDGNDEIIGGGSTILGTVPANGKAEVKVLVLTGDNPARVELYGSIFSLISFEE